MYETEPDCFRPEHSLFRIKFHTFLSFLQGDQKGRCQKYLLISPKLFKPLFLIIFQNSVLSKLSNVHKLLTTFSAWFQLGIS